MKAELSSLLGTYDQYALECDGMTRVLHTVLEKQNIPHTLWVGTVRHTPSDTAFAPHFWITIGDIFIDYRARMWLGNTPDIPHGIFALDEFPAISYEGEETQLAALSDQLFRALTTW